MERGHTSESAVEPPPMLIAIGASNLSRGLPHLVATVRGRAVGAADWFIAAGHGRSYGANSRVWMRRLPSILWCGLWRGIERGFSGRDRPMARAIITDIGNDLLYGFDVDQVASWVEECLRRLTALGIQSVVTRLPMASIRSVSRLQYAALRTLYVPGCRMGLDELLLRAESLDRRVVEIATAYGRPVIEQPGDWYGLDAIHVRRRWLPALWSRVANAWGLGDGRPVRRPLDRVRLGLSAAEVRSLGGFVRLTAQPAVHLDGHSRMSFF